MIEVRWRRRGWIEEIERKRPKSVEDVRQIACQNALAFIDADTSDTWIDAYLRLVGPGLSAFDVRAPRFSGCGVVGEGLLRMLDAPIEEIHNPYVVGRAISRVISHGIRHETWYHATHWVDPPPDGVYMVIGTDTPEEAYGGSAHALTVVGYNPWTSELVSVDGGQPSPHGDGIRLRVREWRYRDGRPILRDYNGSWRRVLGWYDPCC